MIFKHIPRLLDAALIALMLVAVFFLMDFEHAKLNMPVMVYKLAMDYIAGFCGYLFDLSLFPYARPHGYLDRNWRDESGGFRQLDADYPVNSGYRTEFNVATIRRAIIVFAFIEGMTRGM